VGQVNESSCNRSEQILFTRRQQPHPYGNDRERIIKARQEAEALFTSKRPISEPSVPHPQTPAEQSPRKPRILRALSTPRVHHEEDQAPVCAEERLTREIPSSQFGRIRAWVKYGMTAAQVAGLYGVAVGAIERILRQA
jgi:hypothetical protein